MLHRRAEVERLTAALTEAEHSRAAVAERQFGERQAANELQAELERARVRVASAQRDVAAQRAASEALEAELQDVKAQRDHSTAVRTKWQRSRHEKRDNCLLLESTLRLGV